MWSPLVLNTIQRPSAELSSISTLSSTHGAQSEPFDANRLSHNVFVAYGFSPLYVCSATWVVPLSLNTVVESLPHLSIMGMCMTRATLESSFRLNLLLGMGQEFTHSAGVFTLVSESACSCSPVLADLFYLVSSVCISFRADRSLCGIQNLGHHEGRQGDRGHVAGVRRLRQHGAGGCYRIVSSVAYGCRNK